jgi:hypothetical protein
MVSFQDICQYITLVVSGRMYAFTYELVNTVAQLPDQALQLLKSLVIISNGPDGPLAFRKYDFDMPHKRS